MNNIFTIIKNYFKIYTSAPTSFWPKIVQNVKCYVFWFMNSSSRNRARALITRFYLNISAAKVLTPCYFQFEQSPIIIYQISVPQISRKISNKFKVEAPAHKVGGASRLQWGLEVLLKVIVCVLLIHEITLMKWSVLPLLPWLFFLWTADLSKCCHAITEHGRCL